MVHINSNKRYRLGLKKICKNLCFFYRKGIPKEIQPDNNRFKPRELRIYAPDGRVVSAGTEPVPVKSPYGDRGKVVAHYGLPENLPHLLSFL